MVSVCTVPARGGRSCEHFGGYKTLNRIPLPLFTKYFGYCICVSGGGGWARLMLPTRIKIDPRKCIAWDDFISY